MGVWPWSNRVMVEECSVLSVFDPETKKKITKFAGDNSVEVIARRDDIEIFRQNLFFVKTPVTNGGSRYWFRCYICKKKVAKLYLPPKGRRYACRKCHNLTYRSQKEHDKTLDKYLKNPAMIRLLNEKVDAGDINACGLVIRAVMKGRLK